MILLDTNVLSEPLKPDPIVLDWLDRQHLETLFLSAITLAELRYGVAVLPQGRRRENLSTALENRIISLFAKRILPVDTAAAEAYAVIRAHARREGKAIGATDGYIAATAKAYQFTVATRDTVPFEAAGVTIINPWVKSWSNL